MSEISRGSNADRLLNERFPDNENRFTTDLCAQLAVEQGLRDNANRLLGELGLPENENRSPNILGAANDVR
ncbi:MAG: hypothetical protein ACI4JT_05300 [Oscillospiraceae bacterium]